MTTVTRYPTITATGPGPRLELLTNRANNPRAVNMTGLKFAAGSGATYSTELFAAGGPLKECPSFARLKWNTAQTANTSAPQLYSTDPAYNLVEAGKSYLYRVFVRSSLPLPMQPKIGAFNGTAYLTAFSGPAVEVPANRWTELAVEFTAPANCTRVQLNADPTSAAPLRPAGSQIDITGWMLHEKLAGEAAATPYGDGDMSGWEWLGAPHASPSRGFGAVV